MDAGLGVLLPALHRGMHPVAVFLADVFPGNVVGFCIGCLASSSLVTMREAFTIRSSTTWASG